MIHGFAAHCSPQPTVEWDVGDDWIYIEKGLNHANIYCICVFNNQFIDLFALEVVVK